MQLYLAVTPDDLPRARAYTPYIAHVAYRIGADGHLLRAALPRQVRGGMAVLSDHDAPAAAWDNIVVELTHECQQRGYTGVILDFEGRTYHGSFVRALDEALHRARRRLIVPEQYAACTSHAAVLINTALSGGTLRERLSQAAAQYGAARLILDLQRLMMDFPLPCPSGEGRGLSCDALHRLKEGRAIFFSEELCARYFTYRRGGSTRFVLFDDGDTLRRKMQLGESLGIGEGLLMYPEVADLLDTLYAKKEELNR